MPRLPTRTTEFRVARAETRTTDSTLFDDDASTFRKLCELLAPNQADLIRLDESTDGVRGVYTTREVAEGDLILSIPLDHCLRDDDIPFWMEDEAYEEDSDDSNSYSASAWAKRLAGSLIDLQLQVMKSIADEPSELWLNLLPHPSHLRSTLPIHWSEDVLTSARCAALELAVDSAYFARAEATADLLTSLEACKTADLLSNENLRIMTENALDVVQTRTCRVVSPEDGSPLRLLAPLFDMLNHGNSPNAQFQVEQLTSKTENNSYDALVVRATKKIDANSEVFISYGASTKPSWRCLVSYGFVPPYDPAEEEYDEEAQEMIHSAELFLEGMRYEVGPGSVSQELVDAMAECVDPSVQKPALFTSEIALRLAQRISEASFQMLLDTAGKESLENNSSVTDENEDDGDDEDEDEWSIAQVIASKQAAALRWNQHRILMACSLGLRDWAAGQAGSNL